ncbi:MAG TPA: biopolymer transporter ExbD [Gemmatimonadales bacterium]|nr:biopolymer transporter ExbD [Gemmatimonadales bacterium]
MGADVGGHGGVKSEPNVVPMIDIMLVLLIIFMIVTPVITAGFQAKIPQGKNIDVAEEQEGDVTLGIDRDGNYYLDPGSGNIAPVSAERLASALQQVYETRSDKKLYFRAHADLDYAAVEDAMQVARKAGVRLLAAVTEEKRDGGAFGRRRGD